MSNKISDGSYAGVVIGTSLAVLVTNWVLFTVAEPVGLWQFVYVVPMFAAVRTSKPLAIGILIGASLTLLLNTTCWSYGLHWPPQSMVG